MRRRAEERRVGVVANPAVTQEKAALARRLRAESTEAERWAWELLRGRRCLGMKFRRQQVISGFVVDFYCAEHRLAVEIDGPIHDDQRDEDLRRDAALARRGIRVLRIRNEDVDAANLEAAVSSALRLPLSSHGEGAGG